jgi:enamine deaminase RidA (YjgF/YER057c/UK114 family)
MDRTNLSYPGIWPNLSGASALVKIDKIITTSGMVASDPNGTLVGSDSAYEQTKYIFKKIQKLLHDAGADLKDIIKVTVYTTDAGLAKEIGKAHKEILGDIAPCSSLIEVRKFILPEYLVAIEVTAITQN